jgi:hypothetical protein
LAPEREALERLELRADEDFFFAPPLLDFELLLAMHVLLVGVVTVDADTRPRS